MKERPILFSAPMVRALLDGSKTQTRRVVKTDIVLGREALFAPRGRNLHAPTFLLPDAKDQAAAYCPHGKPGDRLWVRETFREWPDGIAYRANYSNQEMADVHKPWKPSIFMPRAASRITLEITGVRVERLHDISEDDCWAEGIEQVMHDFDDASQCTMAKRIGASIEDAKPLYAQLWESINGPGSWDLNPWVWVIEFKRAIQDLERREDDER